MADATQNGPQGGILQFMMANKLEAAMWLSRLFTVYCSILFIFPFMGLYEAANFYQRALLANALTSALRLHQRLPHFQLSRAFLSQALLEDSCHYLLFSLIFVNSYPVTMSIFPVFLFSLLHATAYTKKIIDMKINAEIFYDIITYRPCPSQKSLAGLLSLLLLRSDPHYRMLQSKILGPTSLAFLRSILDKISANQQNILKFIACNEIFLMPATVFMLLSGTGSLLQPFIYYRFLVLRYSSQRNPYCRTLFSELKMLLQHLIMKPACPGFLRNMCLNCISFISRLAPTAN